MERALSAVNVPSYVIDRFGIIRWLNPAAERVVGDVCGRQFTSVCAPEETRHARELFVRKLTGSARVTDAEITVIEQNGVRATLELSSVPLLNGHRVVGVFGQVTQVDEEHAAAQHPHLTPRQSDILRLLEHGRSTAEMAKELHLSTETVRNHVRGLLRALGVHSRIEAVAMGRQLAAR
jgi:PAS domain S-box-containing protein